MKQLKFMQAWQRNSLEELLVAGALLVGVLVVIYLLRYGVRRALGALAARSGVVWHEVAAYTVDATRVWLLFPVALYAGAAHLDLPVRLDKLVDAAVVIGLMLQVAAWGSSFVRRWFAVKAKLQAAEDAGASTALGLISFLARLLVWALAALLILDHLNVDITALVAGLGIGGVAVALALQNILADLFASLSIVLDKPFVVGDFIVVDDLRGTVERVGVKTTRLRSLDGEQLVISNGDLLKSRIHNYKRMTERRVLFTLGVTYETPAGKLGRVPALLREIVEAQPNTRFDRAHFKEYGDFALIFEIVYYVLDRDYGVYMNVQQALNLEIFHRFQAEGLSFAYPTRTLYVHTEPAPASAPEEKAA